LVAIFELEGYNINVSAEPIQGGEVFGTASNVPFGTMHTVYASPLMNYDFYRWMEGDSMASDQAEFSFPVMCSRDLVAHFTPKEYTITLAALPPDAALSLTGDGIYPYQEYITVSAVPKPNYVFEKWAEWDGDSLVAFWYEEDFPFAVTRSRDLIAVFRLATYNIILSALPPDGGTADSTEYNIPWGTLKTITATPFENYYFGGWRKEDGTPFSSDPVYPFEVTESLYLTAHFTAVTHTVTLLSIPSGGGILLGGGPIPIGKETTIVAIPDGCYDFIEWRDDKDSLITTNLSFTVTVEEDLIFLAYFVQRNISITTSVNEPEWGTAVGEYPNIPCGTSVTVTAIPKEECYFVYWTKGDEVVCEEEKYTFVSSGDCHLVAHFAPNTYTIILLADPPDMGKVSQGGTFPYNSEFTAVAYPNEGFSFTGWTEDSTQVWMEAHYTFVVKKSRILVANFEKTRYTVTVIVNDTALGYATGGGKYDYEEPVELRAFAKNGYRFVNWTINGDIVELSSVYEFIVTESITIVANFYGLEFDEYAATLWDNTFMLNLNKLEGEEYVVVDCKWFKNGKEELETHTLDAYSYSAGPNRTDLLELAPTYYMFRIITDNGSLLNSTLKMLTEYRFNPPPLKSPLIIYPNPVLSGNVFTIEGLAKNTPIEVFSQIGVCVSRTTAHNEKENLRLELPAGVYIIRNNGREGKIVIER